MESKEMKILQKLKLIGPVLILNIVLPTVDVGTDLNLIQKLYVGTYSCNSSQVMRGQWEEYVDCLEHSYSTDLCPHPRDISQSSKQFIEYDLCREDSYKYCSSNITEENFCGHYENHPRFASSLLTFYLINYLVCLLTFLRLEKTEKRRLFIFPLLNLYPQYGE